MILFITIFSVYSAQKISISGKVTNQSGTPIGGATISLPSANLNTKTDGEGRYSLVGEIASIRKDNFSKINSVFSFENGIINLSLSKREDVRIELFDLKGNLLRLIEKKSLEEGNYNISLKKYSIPFNIVIACITIGKTKSNILYMPMAIDGVSSHSVNLHKNNITYESKIVAVVDTLVVSAQTYKTKKVPISSYEGTVDIILEKEDVGNCTPSTRVNTNVSGNGPHKVVVETNSEAGIKEGTIYRPEDLGPGKNYPIFIWGEGGCSQRWSIQFFCNGRDSFSWILCNC